MYSCSVFLRKEEYGAAFYLGKRGKKQKIILIMLSVKHCVKQPISIIDVYGQLG